MSLPSLSFNILEIKYVIKTMTMFGQSYFSKKTYCHISSVGLIGLRLRILLVSGQRFTPRDTSCKMNIVDPRERK